MIPILFHRETEKYDTNGIGRLSDCISCLVTEERNGRYECEFAYPITGPYFAEILEGRKIVVTHDDQGDSQPFIIYGRSAPINGVVTFFAHHISYELSNVIVSPFRATSVVSAFLRLKDRAITDNPFTLWTDKTSSGSFEVKVPSSVRNVLGGTEGSILDAFGGGEYEFDNRMVRLYAHRGRDNGVTIRYGKNLTDLRYETDEMDLYSAVIPYWSDGEGTVVYGGIVVDENYAQTQDAVVKVKPLDLSAEYEAAPTVQQLETMARTFLAANTPWVPKVNLKVSFLALWQTEEYKDLAPLERVRLCDTVSIYYSALGVSAKAKVVKTVWNALLDKYDSIELGETKVSFADAISAEASARVDARLNDIPNKSMMEEAIGHATDLITGGMGGHLVFMFDGNGYPTDMLVMDTDSISTAVNVLRINVNGIGFSQRGVNGPFTSAWTLDGEFVADFITAGHMRANMIQGGTLTLGGSGDGNGTLELKSATDALIVLMNNEGLSIIQGNISLGNGVFAVTNAGKLTASDATIKGSIRSEDGQEWFLIDESVATGGYGSTTHGLLDLSAQTGSGSSIQYDVALEAKSADVRIKSETKNIKQSAYTDIELDALNGDVKLKVKSGKNALYVYNGVEYPIVATSGTDNTGKIRHLHRVTSQGTTYLGITNFSGNTLFAALTASDEKIKENIKDAGDVGLEAINRIRHKSFDFIDGGYHRDCGYIAQQLQEAIPYSTIAAPEMDEEGNKIGETLQLNDHEILVYATKAIQELSAKVNELERRLAENGG